MKSVTIKFTIPGNHEDSTGNPIPKIKRTRHQYWTPEAQRYAQWKEYVQSCFYGKSNIYEIPVVLDGRKRNFIGITKQRIKPITLGKGQHARMDLKIWWANEAHADPENVFGSIADAIFQDDKNLDGSFRARIAKDGKGRVEVAITIGS